jgi:mono/diheme cytochrome c family protein
MKSLLLLGAITIPVAAFTFGGWAVVTVENVPEYAVVGRPVDITYTVRQHGMTTREALPSKIHVGSGSLAMTVNAQSLGEGVYRAQVVFARPGKTDLYIESGWGPVGGEMLPLNVVAANAPAPAPMSAYDRGHQLYLAKGCATCHAHLITRKDMRVNWNGPGPDLSEPKFTAAYLERFLANPAVKTDWKSANRMPNLGLKPAEITALVAFLNQEKK